MPNAVEVWIWLDKDGCIAMDCDPVIIAGGTEEVRWRLRPGYHKGLDRVTIRFTNAGPFVSHEFPLPLGGAVSSGPAGFAGDFKYDIEVLPHAGSLRVKDPRVIVEDPKPTP
jgi:hypothetical protein